MPIWCEPGGKKKNKRGGGNKKSFATSMQTLHIHYRVELRERV